MKKRDFAKLKAGEEIFIEYLMYGYSLRHRDEACSSRGTGPWRVTIVAMGPDFLEFEHRTEGGARARGAATRRQVVVKV